MKYYPGVRKINTTAAQKYSVRDNYHRPDQKNNLVYQGDWNPDLSKLSTVEYVKKRHVRVSNNDEGFSVLNWAFLQGALANSNAARFVVNVPNKGGTSWSSIENSAWGTSIEMPKIGSYQGNPINNTKIIKKMGRFFGADLVGVCQLDRRWVYSHYYNRETKRSYPIRFSDEIGYEGYTRPTQLEDGTQVIPKEMKYAIVFIHEMDYSGIKTAPSLTQMATTMATYSRIALTTMSIAEFIRGLGYQSIPSANCTALNIPLAIDAGLGELGRNAKLINPLFGPRCRISKVITDFPVIPDKPIEFGVSRFCRTCKKCAEACEVKAIPMGEPSYIPKGNYSQADVLQWQIDHEKCRRYWTTEGTNCGICISVCPYNKINSPLHLGLKSIAALFPVFNKLLIKMNDYFGYDSILSSAYFWKDVD